MAGSGGSAVWGRLAEWTRRYGPPEVAGTISAVGSAFVAHSLSDNLVVTAYAGAIGENLGFYAVVFTRELRADARRHRASGLEFGWSAAMATCRKLLVEFGPAEALDTGVVRPLAMGLSAQLLGPQVGIIVGKFVGDFCFYLPVVLTYEWRRYRERQAQKGAKA